MLKYYTLQNELTRFKSHLNSHGTFSIHSDDNEVSSATLKRQRKRNRQSERRKEQLASQYPFIKKLAEQWSLKEGVVSQILNSFKPIVDGNDTVLMSPSASILGATTIYDDFINEVLEPSFDTLIKEVQDVEDSNLKKYGPRSIQQPLDQRWDGILEHFKQFELPTNLIEQLNSLADLTNSDLRPVNMEHAVQKLRGSTAAGLPTLGKKRENKYINVENFDEWINLDLACMLYTRTQEGNKTRLVWGYPTVNMIDEQKYYLPVLKYQQQNAEWRKAIVGTTETDKAITEIIDFAKANDLYIVSIDFSSYDASVGIDLQKAAFRYISNLYQGQYSDDIERLAHTFGHIPLLTPKGLLTGPHGVPSGSAFTNEIDSIAQYLVAVSSGLIYEDYMQIQGDDGVYVTSEPDKLLEHFEKYGLDVSKDKTMISKSTVNYLQKTYNTEYRLDNGIIGGIYPVSRALLRLVFMERFVELKDVSLEKNEYFAIRAIGILENCKYHPMFKQLIDFIMKIDKVGLSVKPDALKEYVRFVSEKSGRFDNITNQYGEELKGIANFETIKYINSLED